MSRRRRTRARRPLAAAAILALAPIAAAGAQAACGGVRSAERARAARTWPAPLDRTVALHARDVPLRTALDRLAADARVRLSYSAEALPLDRRVCVDEERVSIGDALVELLAGTAVAPIVAGADQIVLAPSSSAAGTGPGPALARTTGILDRVVVTGTAVGATQRASPYAVDVVDGATLARQASGGSLASILDAAVPGLWLWTQAPTNALARYGSVRGASSLGVSSPKIYVDGIEVANPLLVTQLDPASVQRVEVIRGPQGAALYGADAISGVVNVITRHDGPRTGVPAAEVRSSAGASRSEFATNGAFVQDHALSLRGGTGARSGTLGVTLGTVGAYVPGASARQILGDGGVRLVGARSLVTGTVRFAASDASTPASPVLNALARTVPTTTGLTASTPPATTLPGETGAPRRARADDRGQPRADSMPRLVDAGLTTDTRQSVRQYTVGAAATFMQSARWTHALVAGVDGYRLDGVSSDGVPVLSAADSALRAARGGADRATVRLSSTARLGESDGRALTLIVAAEQSTARERTQSASPLLAPGASIVGAAARRATWWSNSGVSAQLQGAWRDALFVTAGERVERSTGPYGDAQVALLPMLGAAWVREHGGATVKLRAAYGKGIRPARTVARGGTWTGGAPSASTLSSLAPEEQAGVEAGADVGLGRHVAFHVTRFDQRVSGLVQPVAVVADGSTNGGRRLAYELQNVGAIVNRGWELQGTTGRGPLSIAATLSIVSSRVDRLANGYRGDLRTGDRVLEVPARTGSVTATWSAPRWSASWTVTRATDWINYDRLALAEAIAGGTHPTRDFVGAQLRTFWRSYDGVTRVRASGAYTLRRDLALTLTGDNLLDRQRGEPDNVTVLPGRTLSIGVRTGF